MKRIRNKNSGFTLVELLFTIGLLAITITSVTMSMSSMLKTQRTNQFNQYKREIEDAACVYVSLENNDRTIKNVNISTLEVKGLVAENYTSPIPVKEEKDSVIVDWTDEGEKTCTYDIEQAY